MDDVILLYDYFMKDMYNNKSNCVKNNWKKN